MKHTKKLVSLLLTLVMVLSMSVTVFAANDSSTYSTGTITIDNATVGETYSIYRILNLESYSTSDNPTDPDQTGTYSYKVNEGWKSFFANSTEEEYDETYSKGLDYVTISEDGYVSWKNGSDVEAFAKAALAYAKEKSVNPATVPVEATESTVKFENLSLGYYLVDTTLGTLCSLDTTNPNVTMREKNTAPTITKQVQEGENWGNANTAQIGDTVNFKVTIKAYKGAENYVLHDKMDEGLTLNDTSIVVKATPKNGTETTLTANTEYTVASGNSVSETDESKRCTFEIKFKDTYLNDIEEETDIVVTYSAVLNEKAKIYEDTNNNTAKLTYADNNTTEESTTTTTTFKFDIVKTDSSNKLLDGAEFELYDAQNGGNKISLVKESDESYRVATSTEKSAEGFTTAVIKAGKVTVKGLDANTTYWLEETKAPAGYNKLSGRVKVEMKSGNKTATMTDDNTYESGGVHIINNTGTELPSTGGIGTTIFYVAGSVLVLAAAVLLITKKRMSEEK